jgi:hypothetical protein
MAVEPTQSVLKVAEWWWKDSLSREPTPGSESRITDVLGFVVRISGVEGPLATWAAMPPGPADDQLNVLCRMWLPDLLGGNLEVGWAGGWDIATPLTAWLLKNAEPRLTLLGERSAPQLRSLEELARRQG